MEFSQFPRSRRYRSLSGRYRGDKNLAPTGNQTQISIQYVGLKLILRYIIIK
jgi:hypothetical protein